MNQLLTIVLLCCTVLTLSAQPRFRPFDYGNERGRIGFTQASYHRQGLDCKNIELKIDNKTWVGGELPLGKKMYLSMVEPKGFTVNEDGKVFPNIRLELLKGKESLGVLDKFLGEHEGVDPNVLSDLHLTLGLDEEEHGTGPYTLIVLFYDEDSDKKFTVTVPFYSVKEGTPLETASFTNIVQSSDGWSMYYAGVDVKTDAVYDNNKRPEEPTPFVRRFVLPNVNIAPEEFEKGLKWLVLYNEEFNRSLSAQKQVLNRTFTCVPSEDDPSRSTITCILELDPSVAVAQNYSMHFYWRSSDKSRIIDLLVR